jgi:macrophage erythroblast attacher
LIVSLQVPFESLKRTTRDRKYAIDDLKGALQQAKTAASSPGDADDVAQRLQGCLRLFQRLKRKLDDASAPEREDASRVRARLEHLRDLGHPARDGCIAWSRGRIDRLLVDHMLRNGYLNAAEKLARSTGTVELTELHIFQGVRPVLESLHAHECTHALEWCRANAARLNKVRSPLEFELRVQEYIELVKFGRTSDAIAYARQHLAPWAAQRPVELHRAAALLAFPKDTCCEPYASLLSRNRWKILEELFKTELFRLCNLPSASLLEVHLQAGLSALKTPQSLAPGCGREDPLHLPSFRQLAAGLPSAKHVHSKLVCALSGEVMSEHNPPLVMPNGYVYSQAALEAMAAANGGKVKCPETGIEYDMTELRRAFVM